MENGLIYEAIVKTMEDIGAVGKNSKNTQQGYIFRGIDAVQNAMHPAMVKNGIFVVPTVVEESREERTTAKGSVLYVVRLTMDYTFFAKDGSHVTARVVGEAMDSADKGTNKAMSIAFKYACFQVFCIPTEEMKESDPDNYSPEETKPQYIDEVKIATLKKVIARKGLTDDKILGRYKLKSFEEMTVDIFMKAMSGLEKTPDKQEEPVDLGFNQ